MSFPSRSFFLFAENRKLSAFPPAPGSVEVQGFLFRAASGAEELSCPVYYATVLVIKRNLRRQNLSCQAVNKETLIIAQCSHIASSLRCPGMLWVLERRFTTLDVKKSNSIEQGWRWMYSCWLQTSVLWSWHSVSSYDYLEETCTRLVLSTVSHGVGGNH